VVCSNGRMPVQLLNTRINRDPLDVVADVSSSKLFGHLAMRHSYMPPSPRCSGLHMKVKTAISLLREPLCLPVTGGDCRVRSSTIWTLECWYDARNWFYGHVMGAD
jgi:hypothetical protein